MRTVCAALVAFGLLGCDAEDAFDEAEIVRHAENDEDADVVGDDNDDGRSADGTPAAYTTQVDVDGQPHDLPIASIEVSQGAMASFFAWKDGSAGYLFVAEPQGSVGPQAKLDGLSVAEVFWALSPEGTDVPVALLEHHEAMEFGDERPSWGVATAMHGQGWFRNEPVHRALAECVNSTFNATHCGLGAGWTNKACSLDGTGSYVTDAWGAGQHGTLRFHAAFCIDGPGQIWDTLMWASECPGNQGLATIWAGYFSDPAYAAFTWIAPSSIGTARRWRHSGVVATYPGNRDWASKWGPDTACYPF